MKIILRRVTMDDASFLYDLLKERTPEQSISHRAMPPYDKHVDFIASNPYSVWYVIEAGHKIPVGAVYLTKSDEIGIFVLKAFQKNGFGEQAVRDLMKMHKRKRYLANVNPLNAASQKLFQKMGFNLIQFTFEHEPAA